MGKGTDHQESSQIKLRTTLAGMDSMLGATMWSQLGHLPDKAATAMKRRVIADTRLVLLISLTRDHGAPPN